MLDQGGLYAPFYKHPTEIAKRLLDGTASEIVPHLMVLLKRTIIFFYFNLQKTNFVLLSRSTDGGTSIE